MPEKEQSVMWVVAMVMLVIAAFGWAFMAAGYAHAAEGWRSEGVAGGDAPPQIARAGRRAWVDFVFNAVKQIPNFFAVCGYSFSNQIWLPILFAVLEVLAVGGGYAMIHVEKALNSPRGRR